MKSENDVLREEEDRFISIMNRLDTGEGVHRMTLMKEYVKETDFSEHLFYELFIHMYNKNLIFERTLFTDIWRAVA